MKRQCCYCGNCAAAGSRCGKLNSVLGTSRTIETGATLASTCNDCVKCKLAGSKPAPLADPLVPPSLYSGADALAALEGILGELPGEYRKITRLLYGVCLGTIITGTLTRLPKDERVVAVIRRNFSDHAADEARHHRLFSAVFRAAWPQVNRRQKEVLGPLLTRFLRLLLDPDIAVIRRALKSLPLDADAIGQVIAETYPVADAAASASAGAKPTLHPFEAAGVLEVAAAKEAFDELGLLG